MKIWVAITDTRWFEFLRARSPDEVNFWQPSAGRRAAVLEPGTPFLFKLHAPDNFIVGVLADFVKFLPTHEDHVYLDFVRDGALAWHGGPPGR